MTRVSRSGTLLLVVAVSLVACREPESADGAPACAAEGRSCTGDASCCLGLACDASTGVCTAATCVGAGASCAGGEPCCGQAACVSATCTSVCLGDITCIAPGAACEFTEQCCQGRCLQDGAGLLRCTTCGPDGARCSGAGDNTCCAGTTCTPVPASGEWSCRAYCASGGCCLAEGQRCSIGNQCCTGTCDAGSCKICVRGGSGCTADGDCCSGTVCNIPSGATSGTCTPRCAPTGGSCIVTADCCIGACAAAPGATTGTCACGTGL